VRPALAEGVGSQILHTPTSREITMGLLDKVKIQAEQTAAKAREGVQEVQSKRELSQAYANLGKTVVSLVERGEISNAEITGEVEHIHKLIAESQIDQTT
jgi:hypothetical protein